MGNAFFPPQDQLRLNVVGLDAAGKTSLLYKLKIGEVVTTIPTIGFNVETIEHRNINISCWDIGYSGGYPRRLRRFYYQGSDALIFVIDASDRDVDRLDQAQDELFETLREWEVADSTELPGKHPVLLILANKQDRPNAMSADEIAAVLGLYHGGISSSVGMAKHPRWSWNIRLCCTLTGEGLDEGLDWLSHTILSIRKNQPKRITEYSPHPTLWEPSLTTHRRYSSQLKQVTVAVALALQCSRSLLPFQNDHPLFELLVSNIVEHDSEARRDKQGRLMMVEWDKEGESWGGIHRVCSCLAEAARGQVWCHWPKFRFDTDFP